MGKRMTEKAIAANRRNAQRSTGPKTADGKAVTSLNALKHGLRSSSLAVPHLEDADNWEAHLTQTLKALSPVGYLETVLAERAASVLWRLGRAVRYESLIVTASMETAAEDCFQDSYGDKRDGVQELKGKLDQARDEAAAFETIRTGKASAKVDAETAWGLVEDLAKERGFELWEGEDEDARSTLDLSEIPDEDQVDEWDGWTAGYLRKVLAQVAEGSGGSLEPVLDAEAYALQVKVQEAESKLKAAEAELERWKRTHLLPDEGTLDKVSKYESTLERSLFRTLHELERIQAARAGEAVPLPAVAEISVSGDR